MTSFSKDPLTQWLTSSKEPDRTMQLLEDFSFNDNGRIWLAPKGSVVDGASIPRALWTLVGSPYTGYYRRASIVHDVACEIAGSDRRKRLAADKMFYRACRTGGCSVREATILYIGVRIGANVDAVPAWEMAIDAVPDHPRLARTASEAVVENDFRALTEAVLAEGETDDVELIERRFARAFTAYHAPVVERLVGRPLSLSARIRSAADDLPNVHAESVRLATLTFDWKDDAQLAVQFTWVVALCLATDMLDEAQRIKARMERGKDNLKDIFPVAQDRDDALAAMPERLSIVTAAFGRKPFTEALDQEKTASSIRTKLIAALKPAA